MEAIIEKYKAWKEKYPNVDYQYDEIHKYYAELNIRELRDIMEYLLYNQ